MFGILKKCNSKQIWDDIKIAKIKNVCVGSCWWGCGGRGNLFHCGGCMNLYSQYGYKYGDLLGKIGIYIPQDPDILLLCIYPKDIPSHHKDIYSTMFIVTLFLTARNWKAPRFSLAKEWRRKMWYIYLRKYYSDVKNMTSWKFQENGWN